MTSRGLRLPDSPSRSSSRRYESVLPAPHSQTFNGRDSARLVGNQWYQNGERAFTRVLNRLSADKHLGELNDMFRRHRIRNGGAGPIPVYWFRSRNFGDAMAPDVFEAASHRRAAWVTKRFQGKVVLQGSVLGWALAPRDLVWGAGLLKPTRLHVPKDVTFLAVRGPLTRSLITADVPSLYCDPGALAPLVYESAPSKTYSIGIVPHYLDHPHMAIDDPHILVIDVLKPIQQVVRMITSCDLILSSSLHGIVVAEAFGIPASWITSGDRLIGGDFKFRDYYLGTDREPMLAVEWSGGISRAVAQVRDPGVYRTRELINALDRAIG